MKTTFLGLVLVSMLLISGGATGSTAFADEPVVAEQTKESEKQNRND